MRNARVLPAQDARILRQQRDSLERECEARRIEIAAAEERLAVLRQEATESIKRANEALRVLHSAWALEKEQVQKPRVIRPMTIDEVARRICRVTGITHAEIVSNRRAKNIMFARQAICYWAVRRTEKSLPQIGRYLSRDHTSVMHGRDVYVDKRARMGRTLRVAR